MAFDSREYEFADITCLAGGNDIIGFRGVKYVKKIEREALFAKGRKAHSIQSGNESVEGEITVTTSELNKLIDAGKGSILSLNIDLQVSFGNPSNGDAIRHNRVVSARFTEEPEEWKQGDKFAEHTLPFLALDVKKNI